MDALRTCRIKNLKAPIGTPIHFNGEKIGRVVEGKDEDYCEIAINSDEVYSLLRNNQSCSMVMCGNKNRYIEVVRK